MDIAEKLTEETYSQGAEIIEWIFESGRIKGLYCDGVIAVSKDLDTRAERAGVIAEELGHHLTATGNILDQSITWNRKQEFQGRIWAYNRLIGLEGILRAYKAGCRNRYEMAELLEVPEETLQEALDYYRSKYGLQTQTGNFVICFEPLGVFELI